MLDEAWTLLKKGEYQQVIERFGPVTPIDQADPEVFMLLGAAHQGLEQESLSRSYYEKAIALLGDLVNKHEHVDVAWTNICLLNDRLQLPKEVEKNLRSLRDLSSDRFDVWFALGFLHQKYSMFEEGLRCFKEALKHKPNDIETLIGVGYCHEGLYEFDKAIEATEKAKRIIESSLSPESKFMLAEACHALGHFYIEKSYIGRETHPDLEARDAGDRLMSQAADLNIAYITCVGSSHSETKRYHEAIEIFDEALENPQVRSDIVLYNEIFFYRGEAYLGAEQYDSAIKDFNRFEDYAKNKQDGDGVAHAVLYKVKTYLKQKGVEELTVDEIRDYIKALQHHQPSDVVIFSVRHEHKRLLGLLKGLHSLKVYLTQEVSGEERAFIRQLLEDFQQVLSPDERLPLVTITDHQDIERHFANYRFITPLVISSAEGFDPEISRSDQFPVWLLVFEEYNIPNELVGRCLYYIGRYCREKTIVVYDPTRLLPLPREVTEESPIIWVDSVDDGLLVAVMSLLHDRIREFFARSSYYLGLAPTSSAPSLVAQKSFLLPISLK